MAVRPAILAVDCGSSGVKTTLIGQSAEPGSIPEVLPALKIEQPNQPFATDSIRDWHPEELIKRVTRAMHTEVIRAQDHEFRIAGIAITSTTSSLVGLERDCVLESPRPLRWDDTQSKQEAEELEVIRRESGEMQWLQPIQADSGIAKAVFLAKNFKAELLDSERYVLEQWSFLNFWLSQQRVQSQTILSRKWGLIGKKTWPKEFSRRLESLLKKYISCEESSAVDWLTKKFLHGEITAAGECIGNLSPKLAHQFRIEGPAIVVATPYDTCAQIVGLGAAADGCSVSLSFGSSLGVCGLLKYSSAPQFGPMGPYPRIPDPQSMMLFDGIASCGSALNYICERYHVLKDGQPDFQAIDNAIKTTPPGSNGVRIIPFFNGGRRTTSRKNSAGRIDGLTVAVDSPLIVRALFESIACIIKTIIQDYEVFSKTAVKYIYAGGAITRMKSFVTLLADICQRTVFVPQYADTSLLGCAVFAAKGLGWYPSLKEAKHDLTGRRAQFEPNREQKGDYLKLYDNYRSAYPEELTT
jgi:sugar (pentulose or hexulose) kinase